MIGCNTRVTEKDNIELGDCFFVWEFCEVANASSEAFGAGMEEKAADSQTQSMYMFEGKDYSQEPSAADLKAFDQLIQGSENISSNTLS